MKKKLIILALALSLALPVLGLAAETATAPEAEAVPQATFPYGGQHGRRWNQASAQPDVQERPAIPHGMMKSNRWNQAPAAPGQPDASLPPFAARSNRWNQYPVAPYRFVDENKDGIFDICENEQGKNIEAPGFIDTDGDGVCDNLGTEEQHQGQMRSPRGGRGQKGHQPGQQNFGGRNRR